MTARNGFDLINTSFLDDSENQSVVNGLDLKSPISKTFAQLEGDDTFPTLRSDGLKASLMNLPHLKLRSKLTFYSCRPTQLH